MAGAGAGWPGDWCRGCGDRRDAGAPWAGRDKAASVTAQRRLISPRGLRKAVGMRGKGREHEARANKHARGGRDRGPRGPVRGEEDLLEHLRNTDTPLVLVLDCVQDPQNLGAILRTADGAGVDAVVSPKDKSAGITDTVRRISVGAADEVPYFQVTNLARAIDSMKELGIWFVGTSDRADRDFYDVDMKSPIGIVMGAEATGLRRLTEERCDFLAKLPMKGSVECLNVSVTTGVCLYEAVRQRLQSS